MKQNCREQAQDGKTPGNDHVSDGITSWRGGHSYERSDIPEKSEASGHTWQQASISIGPAPIDKEEIEKNTERERTGAVADCIYQNRCVQTKAIRHPAYDCGSVAERGGHGELRGTPLTKPCTRSLAASPSGPSPNS